MVIDQNCDSGAAVGESAKEQPLVALVEMSKDEQITRSLDGHDDNGNYRPSSESNALLADTVSMYNLAYLLITNSNSHQTDCLAVRIQTIKKLSEILRLWKKSWWKTEYLSSLAGTVHSHIMKRAKVESDCMYLALFNFVHSVVIFHMSVKFISLSIWLSSLLFLRVPLKNRSENWCTPLKSIFSVIWKFFNFV